MDKCYDCGVNLTKEIKTREHIPAQNLFSGYDETYKINRLVVPACNSCNQKYSKIDQEIRDVLGVINDSNDRQKELTRKAIKSIMRNSNWKKRVDVNGNEIIENIVVSFSYNSLKKLHIKNFKGTFYFDNKYPLPENFHVEIIAEGDEINTKLMMIKEMFKDYMDNKIWHKSGHEDIFKYKTVMINLKEPSENYDFSETKNIDDCDLVVSELLYHNSIHPMIFSAKNQFLDKVKNKNNTQ
jgi:transcriptional regulator NrdR family protein